MPEIDGLSVVIPVFNSSEALPELVERLTTVLPSCARTAEILLVDDGSADDSWRTIQKLAEREPMVRGIALSRNYGQHNALLAGIRDASGEIIVTMDDDLQHRPEEIPRLLNVLTADIDIVYGRAREEEHGFFRSAGSRFSKLAMALTLGWQWASKVSSFRAFRPWLVGAFAHTSDPFVNLDVILSWTTDRVEATTVEMDRRKYGESNYSFRKLVRHTVTMVTAFSAVPLRLVAWMGVCMATFGVVVLAWVLGRLLITGDSVPGFPFLASTIALFSGATLMSLGIIGDYLGRMHFRSMGRPPYWIREGAGAASHGAGLPSTQLSARRDGAGSREVDGVQGELGPEAQADPGALRA
jgi:glycosyltransferase involved in cell wall biosynthesis